jgi:hypothetical protein
MSNMVDTSVFDLDDSTLCLLGIIGLQSGPTHYDAQDDDVTVDEARSE